MTPELKSHLDELVAELAKEGIKAWFDPNPVRMRVFVEVPNMTHPQCILFVEPDTYRGKVNHSKHEYSYTSITSLSDLRNLCKARTFKAEPFAPVAKLVKDIKARYDAIIKDREDVQKARERRDNQEAALKAIREEYPEYGWCVGRRDGSLKVTFETSSPKRVREIFAALRAAGLVL